MVNINIELPDDLHRRLKLAAVIDDKTLKGYLIALLEGSLKEQERAERAPRKKLAARELRA